MAKRSGGGSKPAFQPGYKLQRSARGGTGHKAHHFAESGGAAQYVKQGRTGTEQKGMSRGGYC